MSMFPVSFNPTGGPATSGVSANGLMNMQQPIILNGGIGEGTNALTILSGLGSLAETVGNMNYRIASQMQYSQQTPTESLVMGGSNNVINMLPYIGIGIVGIIAALWLLKR